MADDFTRFAFGNEANDLEEFSSLGILDDAPPPNPRFVRALRGELMERAATFTRQASSVRSDGTFAGSLSAALPTPLANRRPFDRRLTLQLGLVAALLIAMIGSFVLMSGPDKGSNNILNGLATQSNSNDQPFALYRQNAARTGISDQAGPANLPEVAWRVDLRNSNFVPVLAVDGVIYLVDYEGGAVQAVSADTGQAFWSTQVGPMDGPSIAVANGFVYASTSGPSPSSGDPGFLIALDRATGAERWRYESGGSIASAPAVDGDFVYVSSNDGSLRVVNSETGEEAWSLSLNTLAPATPFPSLAQGFLSEFSPAIANGMVYVTNNDGVIYAIDIQSHQIAWQFRTDGNVLTTPAIQNGTLYLSGRWVQDGTDEVHSWLYELNAATGERGWTKELDDYAEITGLTGQWIYIETTTTAQKLDRRTGNAIWTNDVRDRGGSLYTNEFAYVAFENGTISALALRSSGETAETRWSVYIGEYIDGMVPLDGTLYVRTASGKLIALVARAGIVSSVETSGTPEIVATADLSGLQPCSTLTPIDWQNFSGEPASTLVPLEERMIRGTPRPDPQDYGQPPSMSFDDVPDEPAADTTIAQGILLTLHDIATCNQVGQTADVSGFFSDDFFRRHWVKSQFDLNDATPILFLRHVPDWAINYASIVTLPDGRISLYSKLNEKNGVVIVFVERDGRWVIDEIVAVTPVAGAVG